MSENVFEFTNPPSSASSISDSGEDDDQTFIIKSGPKSPIKSPKSPTKSAAAKKKAKALLGSAKSSGRVVHSGSRTLYTAGRPPWYNSQGQLKKPFVIGISGGSASGKTTVARKIIEALDVPWVSLLSMDSFYKVLNKEQHDQAARNEYNFDHPDAFDFELLIATLRRLKEGKIVEVPIYNFQTHSREPTEKTIYGANVVIFEGILTFYSKELLQMMDMKIFVDTDSDVRLARRLIRDINVRGRDLEGVLHQYNKFVKPAFEHYIEPTMTVADIMVPRGGENDVAINLIVLHVHTQLQNRGFKLRSKLANAGCNGEPMPTSLYVLQQTAQILGLHTFIRNKDTARDEFIFYSQRLMRLLFEYAMSMVPFKSVRVETPQSITYEGKRLTNLKICGVSILRAGETMESALCAVCKNIRIGKILIQTNFDTGEPELHYLRLPKDIKDQYVMLMDATVATGAAAMMAIRVLLDHDVKEENITLCSLLMAESGVYSVAYAFPKVKILTTAVDKEVNDKFHILPGIGIKRCRKCRRINPRSAILFEAETDLKFGNFGDRFFGTDYFEQ